MNREAIKEIIPHREPMLLIDGAEVEDNESVGKYTVRGDEWFLQGHFPDNPVVPGVILCEMMAQSACALLANNSGVKATPYLTGLDKVRFKRSVFPKDEIVFTCKLAARRGGFYFIKGIGKVGGETCVSGEFSFKVV